MTVMYSSMLRAPYVSDKHICLHRLAAQWGHLIGVFITVIHQRLIFLGV
jgi:hypothetical protein